MAWLWKWISRSTGRWKIHSSCSFWGRAVVWNRFARHETRLCVLRISMLVYIMRIVNLQISKACRLLRLASSSKAHRFRAAMIRVAAMRERSWSIKRVIHCRVHCPCSWATRCTTIVRVIWNSPLSGSFADFVAFDRCHLLSVASLSSAAALLSIFLSCSVLNFQRLASELHLAE